MLKMKLQYFGHLMWRTDSLEKTLMLGKIEDRRRREQQRMRWLDGITDSVQLSRSVVSRSCDPMNCSTPGLPVHHQLLEPTWTHVHHDGISSSVVPFSSCLQSFPASGSFPMSWFFESGGQSIGVSASASVLPMNIQDWFRLGWTGWIYLSSMQRDLL